MAWTIKILDSAKQDLKNLISLFKKGLLHFYESDLRMQMIQNSWEKRYKDNMPVSGDIELAITA